MARRRLGLPTRKVLIRLFESDVEALAKYFPRAGVNEAVRSIVHRAVKQLDAQTQKELEKLMDEDAIEEPQNG